MGIFTDGMAMLRAADARVIKGPASTQFVACVMYADSSHIYAIDLIS